MKKSNLSVCFAILFLLPLFYFSACNLNAKYYNVSYKTKYGEPLPDVEVLAGSTLTFGQTSTIFSSGRFFQGWYVGDVKVEAGKYVVNSDVTLVAKWDVIDYTISYSNIYETINALENAATYTIEDEVILYPPENTPYYTFDGWFTTYDAAEQNDESKKVEKIEKGSSGNKIFYARWIPKTFTVTYILPDGAKNHPDNPVTVEYGKDYYLYNPSDTKDMTFGGWYDNSDYKGYEITDIPYGTQKPITLYGKYGKKVVVKFESSKGIYEWTNMTPIIVMTGDSIQSSYFPYLYDDEQIVIGWYTTSDFKEGTKFTPGVDIVTKDITLYAKWGYKCSVSYSAGSKTIIPVEVDIGSYITEDMLPLYYSNGKKIAGWYTDKNCSDDSKVIANCYQVKDNITLYAKWVTDNSVSNSIKKDGFVLVEGNFVTGNNYNGVFVYGSTKKIADFLISPYEVTQDLYTKVMNENPSVYKTNPAKGEEQGERPVESVSWYDAIYFCNKYSVYNGFTPCYKVNGDSNTNNWNYTPHTKQYILGEISWDKTANGYRLPTPEEWEYAARGGHKTFGKYEFDLVIAVYDNSDIMIYDHYSKYLDNLGWYWYNICTNGVTIIDATEYGPLEPTPDQNGYGTHAVGKLNPNALGLYDMSGNVGEWIFSEDILTSVITSNDIKSANCYALRNGGAWNTDAFFCRIDQSTSIQCLYGYSGVGFRLVRNIE